jgi:sarcosine oxidase subunit alpha
MTPVIEADVAVVGAGPAGLRAAARLGAAGLHVVVLDEYPVPGGRLLGQRYRTGSGWFVGRAEAARLTAAATRAGSVTLNCGATVYSLVRDGRGFRLDVAGPVAGVRAAACLVATGATEIPVPLPGWTLPGVLAVGAAQVLANVWGVKPGETGIVVGASPLGFAIAQELGWLGVSLRGIVMPRPHPTTAHLGEIPTQWARLAEWRQAAPWWARPGARLLAAPTWQRRLVPRWPTAGVRVAETRLRLAVAAVAVEGERRVEGIRLTRLDGAGHPVGPTWVEPVDFVALAGGLRPIPDLVTAVGAETLRLEGLGGVVPLCGRDGATTVPGLYVAGNTTGVEGAIVAEAQGYLAALGLLSYLGGPEAVEEAEWHQAVAAEERARRTAPLAFHPGVAAARQEMARRWQEHRGNKTEARRDHVFSSRVSHD